MSRKDKVTEWKKILVDIRTTHDKLLLLTIPKVYIISEKLEMRQTSKVSSLVKEVHHLFRPITCAGVKLLEDVKVSYYVRTLLVRTYITLQFSILMVDF